MNEREQLGSRLGFILLSAGCAIGIGNVWKFPWLVGQDGGGLFVLLYLGFLLIMGIPVMAMEFSVGRASQLSPVKMYSKLVPTKRAWGLQGKVALIGNYVIMMFYTTVCGWMIQYFVRTANGTFEGKDKDGIDAVFGEMMSSPSDQWIYMAIAVVIGFLVIGIGLQKGVEKITKIMMLALLAIMVILAINSIFFTEGGTKGLEFYLKPSIKNIEKVGWLTVIRDAMNQSFFTLSIGMGSMAIFGSYINRDRSLFGESITIAGLDTFVAFTSGLIIFPACFAYGVEPDAGPSLIFKTLPNIFNNMAGGRVWGTLFFIFMTFAAFSTVIGVFENIIAMFMDITGMKRRKACLVNAILMLILATPCAFGPNLLSAFQPFGEGSSVMDLEDFIVSVLILPLGSLLFTIFCTSKKLGWGWDKFTEEANQGKGAKVKNWMRFYLTYILPVLIFIVFILGILKQFGVID